MGQKVISRGGEMIRIDPTNANKIQWSSDGRVWRHRCMINYGNDGFDYLVDHGNEILGFQMSGSRLVSKDEGRSWQRRGF